MEQIGNTLAQLQTQFERRKEENTSCHNMTQHVLNTSLHNVYEMIPKKDYAILLNQLEAWNVGSPKAVCRIYGVKTVQRAVAYVKGTPNVRCKGAYFTYMVRQLKSEQNAEPKSTTQEENTKKAEVIKEEVNPSKKRTQPPEIKSPLDANIFICDFEEGKYAETENILAFVRSVKRKFNFG